MIYKFILIFIYLLHSPFLSWAGNIPKASQGLLDLRGWNFQQSSTIDLDGEWEIYWKDFDLDKNKYFITVPKGWQHYKDSLPDFSNYGFASYKLTVFLPPQTPYLALKIKEIETAYELYINGSLTGKTGRISETPEKSDWRFEPRIYSIPHGINQLEIIIKVSNYVYFDGGITNKIILGSKQVLESKSNISIFFELFIFGCLFVIGVYHISFYFFRKKERSPLYFGFFCLIIGIKTLLIGETYISRLFQNIPFEFFFKIDFLTTYLAPPLFVLYFYNLFPMKKAEWIKRIIFLAGILFSLFVILTPAKIFNYTLLFYNPIIIVVCIIMVFHTVILCIRKNKEAWMLLFGFLIFILTIINDVLFSYHYIQTARISSFGLLLFTFTQSILLSFHISKTFEKVESLSLELEKQNMELEQKVKGRTRELEKSHELVNQQNLILQDLNKTKDKLFSIIAHDLKNPFNGILNFLELMIKDIKTMKIEETEEYLQLVHKSSQKAYELLENLLEWARIQTGKFNLNPISIHLNHLVYENLDLLNHIILQKEIDVKADIPKNLMIYGDKNMISTVIRNIISNALKFTPKNQTIWIQAQSENLKTKLVIKDSGVGISPENQKKLFQLDSKFSSAGTEGEQGTGLGLILCKEFILLNKGEISIHSDGTGHGSVVTLVFPEHKE